MKITLKNLKISNFKGIKEKSIDFSSKTKILGRNGAGKSTIFDAMLWLLFGKDSSGSAKFNVRPQDENGVDIDNLVISVTGTFDIDGKETVIEKTQSQKWVKERGAEVKTFKGNENKYTVNTIPKSEKEFKSWLNEIVSEDVFKFVSNLNAFMSQDAKERRKTLFKLVSSITDIEVAGSSKEFEPLLEDLQQFTIEEIMIRAKSILKNLNDKLKDIAPRIDEVTKSMSDVDVAELELQKNSLNEQLAEIEKQESEEDTKMEEFNKISDEIMKVKMNMSDVERKANEVYVSASREHDRKLGDLVNQIESFRTSFNQETFKLTQLEHVTGEYRKQLDDLRNKYKTEKELEFDDSSLICPVCNQTYLEDKQAELKAKFEADKKSKMDSVNYQGKSVSDRIKEKENEINACKVEISNLETKLSELNKSLEDANAEMLPIKPNMAENEEYASLNEKLQSLESTRSSMTNSADYRNQLKIKRKGLNEELAGVQKKIDSADNTEKENRIEELKAEQKQLSQQIADQEKIVFMIEKLDRKKVEYLTEAINKHFQVVKWRFYEPQINGGWNQVCDALVDGKSYFNGLNSGHKMLAELDILSALQKIYDVSTPVFVDNAERLSDDTLKALDLNCQLISLHVANPIYVYDTYTSINDDGTETEHKKLDKDGNPIILKTIYDGSLKVEV